MSTEQGLRAYLGLIEESLDRLDRVYGESSGLDGKTSSRASYSISDYLFKAKSSALEMRDYIEDNILWDKTYSVDIVGQKFVKKIIQEAVKNDISISIAQRNYGKIPLSLMQAIYPAFESLVNLCIERISSEEPVKRLRENRFYNGTISLELTGKSDCFEIKMTDDGPQNLSKAKFKKTIQKIRSCIASQSGFFYYNSPKGYGLTTKVTMPIPRSRVNCKVVNFKDLRVAIPAYSVVKDAVDFNPKKIAQFEGSLGYKDGTEKVILCAVDLQRGIYPIKSLEDSSNMAWKVIFICVADIEVAFLIDSENGEQGVRMHNGEKYLKSSSWHTQFAVFTDETNTQIVPVLSGRDIMGFYKRTMGLTDGK